MARTVAISTRQRLVVLMGFDRLNELKGVLAYSRSCLGCHAFGFGD